MYDIQHRGMSADWSVLLWYILNRVFEDLTLFDQFILLLTTWKYISVDDIDFILVRSQELQGHDIAYQIINDAKNVGNQYDTVLLQGTSGMDKL